MKQERTQSQKPKQYPVNPQARPDYRPDHRDDSEHLPGQRQPPIEAQENYRKDAQTREDVERAEQEGMVKNKEGNQAQDADKKTSQRQQGSPSRKNQ